MEDADSITLDNGIVVAAIKKTNANLLSLNVRGVEFLSKGHGYWNVYGKIPGQANTQEKTVTTPMSWCVIFGGAAGIAEMLLQSQNGEIHLLPALPDSRPERRKAGKLTSTEILSKSVASARFAMQAGPPPFALSLIILTVLGIDCYKFIARLHAVRPEYSTESRQGNRALNQLPQTRPSDCASAVLGANNGWIANCSVADSMCGRSSGQPRNLLAFR